MPAYHHGDTFAIALADGRYVPGRILLDVRAQCVRPGLVEETSPLMTFDGALLVELYDAVSDEPAYVRSTPLIPGVFVLSTAFKSGALPLLGHDAVDPSEVEFPEALMFFYNRRELIRGEVHVPVPEDSPGVADLKLYPSIFPTEQLPGLCEKLLARGERTDAEAPGPLATSDLRFSPHRDAVYEAIGEDSQQSYAEMAAKHGLDLTRFY